MAFYTGKSATYVKDRFNLAPLDISADHIKAEVLSYFRYRRSNVTLCCTEFSDPYSNCIEDIVCKETRNGEALYHSIEVKISESDFKREFWHKKDKHKARGDGRFYDFFYFAVPSDLVPIVYEYLETELLPYGIFSIFYDESKQLNLELKRRAERVTKDTETTTSTIDEAICKRMSSEIAASHVEIYKLKSGLQEVKRQLFYLSQSIKTA